MLHATSSLLLQSGDSYIELFILTVYNREKDDKSDNKRPVETA